MTVTIYEAIYYGAILECKDNRFKEKYGVKKLRVPNDKLVKFMAEITTWVNNDLKEECLFEVG